MTEQQNRIAKYLQKNGNRNDQMVKKNKLHRILASECLLHDSSRFHPIPWDFYQLLKDLEQSVVLAALINMCSMTANSRKSKIGTHLIEMDGNVWFWCSVGRLCKKLYINGKAENRLIKKLVDKGYVSKRTLRTNNRRYLRIHFKRLEKDLQKLVDDRYGDD